MMKEDPNLSAGSPTDADERSLAPYDEIVMPIESLPVVLAIPSDLDDEEMSIFESPLLAAAKEALKPSESSINHACATAALSYPVSSADRADEEVPSHPVQGGSFMELMDANKTTVLPTNRCCGCCSCFSRRAKSESMRLVWIIGLVSLICCIIPVLVVVSVFVHSTRTAERLESHNDDWLISDPAVATDGT